MLYRTLQRHRKTQYLRVLEWEGDTLVSVSPVLSRWDVYGIEPLDLWDFWTDDDQAGWAKGQEWESPILTTKGT